MSLWTRRDFFATTVGGSPALATGAGFPMNVQSQSSRYGMVNKITTKPGQRDAVAKILLSGANMQGRMAGCELYVVHLSAADPNEIWVTEIWRSKQDHEASLQSADVRALIEQGRPMIQSIVPTVTIPVGGKGLTL